MTEDDKYLKIDNIVEQKQNTASVKRTLLPCNNETNKRLKTNVVSTFRKVIKRKFPGPAGVLHEHNDLNLSIQTLHKKYENEDLFCSQTSLYVFQHGPWLDMFRDYETLVKRYNINWIKNMAGFNKLPHHKAPFLAAIIQNIGCCDNTNPVVNVMLKDMTGQIEGTMMYTLYKKYSKYLVVDAGIILKEFSVLTTGTNNNNHHVIITLNNVVAIYVKENMQHSITTVIQVHNINSCHEFIIQMNQNKKVNNESDLSDDIEKAFTKTSQKRYNIGDDCKTELVKVTMNKNNVYQLLNDNEEEFLTKMNQNRNLNDESDLKIPEYFYQLPIELEQYLTTTSLNKDNDCEIALANVCQLSDDNKEPANEVSPQNNKEKPFTCTTNKIDDEYTDIWQTAFEGVNMDAFFDDF